MGHGHWLDPTHMEVTVKQIDTELERAQLIANGLQWILQTLYIEFSNCREHSDEEEGKLEVLLQSKTIFFQRV